MTGDKRKLILVDHDPLCKQSACQYYTSIAQHTIMNSKKSISKSKNPTTHPSLKPQAQDSPHHLHHHSASASESEESVAIIHHTKETSSSTICW